MESDGNAVRPGIPPRMSNMRLRSLMMASMPFSNWARFWNTTRAMACETASTEYGWRTFLNSLSTSALPST